jgi:RNA polymerase sigma-70 factor (ECF subfamily)
MDRATTRNEGPMSASLAVDAAQPAPATPPRRAASKAPTRALGAAYRQHHNFVWRSLARLGVDDDRLGDAVHDTFMVVARRLPEFEGRSSMKTWLFAIALRVAQSYRRDAARERKRRAKLDATPSRDEQPHARADAARTLREMLLKLDDDKRAVFIMAELEGMTAPEISTVLQVKASTVYSRLRLARAELDKMVARHRAREEGGRR